MLEEKTVNLHHRLIGSSGELVVFCHGLFGQGKNWTSIAKALTPDYRGLLVDMPNHGRSDRDDVVDYDRMADAVIELLESQFADSLPCTLVGHSMGGKIVMRVALRRPDIVKRLVVVDMIPAATTHVGDSNAAFARTMQQLDLAALTSRQDADEKLSVGVPDPVVRGFLMQNLRHERSGWHWQMNLDALAAQHETLMGWPAIDARYDGPVLWLAGAKSSYVRSEDTETMRALFPHLTKVVVKDAGHWVHTEQPEVVIRSLQQFLRATP